jgi:hypothetical protein
LCGKRVSHLNCFEQKQAMQNVESKNRFPHFAQPRRRLGNLSNAKN